MMYAKRPVAGSSMKLIARPAIGLAPLSKAASEATQMEMASVEERGVLCEASF
jgi:hypothetical protein